MKTSFRTAVLFAITAVLFVAAWTSQRVESPSEISPDIRLAPVFRLASDKKDFKPKEEEQNPFLPPRMDMLPDKFYRGGPLVKEKNKSSEEANATAATSDNSASESVSPEENSSSSSTVGSIFGFTKKFFSKPDTTETSSTETEAVSTAISMPAPQEPATQEPATSPNSPADPPPAEKQPSEAPQSELPKSETPASANPPSTETPTEPQTPAEPSSEGNADDSSKPEMPETAPPAPEQPSETVQPVATEPPTPEVPANTGEPTAASSTTPTDSLPSDQAAREEASQKPAEATEPSPSDATNQKEEPRSVLVNPTPKPTPAPQPEQAETTPSNAPTQLPVEAKTVIPGFRSPPPYFQTQPPSWVRPSAECGCPACNHMPSLSEHEVMNSEAMDYPCFNGEFNSSLNFPIQAPMCPTFWPSVR